MKDIINTLKWVVIGQFIGIISSFIAYFMPGEAMGGFKGPLFIFGMILIAGYWIYLLMKVYNPLKKEN